jgi:hypothetical protein
MTDKFLKRGYPTGGMGVVAIKAIETHYNGYRFRSRLEARWAVFFDTLNVRYEYEPEGFELLDGTWYLPDFWIADLRSFIDVKGQVSERIDLTKIHSWRKQDAIIVLCGTPGNADIKQYCPNRIDEHCAFSLCQDCGALILVDRDVLPDKDVAICWVCSSRGANDFQVFKLGGEGFIVPDPRIEAAYEAARSARFEHGENGR